MTFIFLPGSDESANDRLARFHEEFLAAGPVGWVEREADFRWLMSHYLPPAPWKQKGTTCALYQGACLMAVGAQLRRPVPPREAPPKAYAITTWVKFSFSGEQWIPIAKLKSGAEEITRGDLLYWSNTTSGEDGHIGCVLTGEGFTWATAEGGGGLPKGTCKLSDGTKDILLSHGRHLRGVVRPNLMKSVILPRPRNEMPTNPDGFLELHRGSKGPRVGQWQIELLRLGYQLPKFGADSDFGAETEAATRAFQIKNTIPNTGVVDRRTWETARALEK